MEPSTNQPVNTSFNAGPKDEVLWRIAKKRASFKWSFVTYLIMNCFFVAVWFYSSGFYSYFWPIWPMLGWGIGIAFHYFAAYHGDKLFTPEEEYERLKNQYNK